VNTWQSLQSIDRLKPLWTCLLVGLLSLPQASADMLISPIRVYLDDDNRSTEVTLRNPSDGPRSYRLEWVEKSMQENGRYKTYDKDEPLTHEPASSLLRFAPRQITVGPEENQTVRVIFRPKGDTQPGEYHSHLLFKVIPELSEPVDTVNMESEEGIKMQLNMQLSLSVPVVVRHNVKEPPNVRISQVKPVQNKQPDQAAQLAVTLEREGLAGSYGQLVVEMQRDNQANAERIGLVDNLSIFPEIDRREVKVVLRDRNIPPGAWLRVAYEGEQEYRDILWDEKIFQIR